MVQQSFLNSTKLQQVASKKRWGHDDAMVILDAWKRSGLSIAEFSREIGIHAWRIGRWRGRIMQDMENSKPKILPVKLLQDNSLSRTSISPEETSLEIELPRGVKIRTRLSSLKEFTQLVFLLAEYPC